MRIHWLPTAALALQLGGASATVGEGAARADADALIRSQIATYAEAVGAADPTLAATVWANTPEVSFIHPLGHEHGWDAIKVNVFQRLMGETFSERKLTVKDIGVHVYGTTAWAEFYWDFAAKFRKDGSPLETHGRETQIYTKLRGRWRLVHVHYSGMPVTGERQGF
jgi:ketosteroid isomerase-like protein